MAVFTSCLSVNRMQGGSGGDGWCEPDQLTVNEYLPGKKQK